MSGAWRRRAARHTRKDKCDLRQASLVSALSLSAFGLALALVPLGCRRRGPLLVKDTEGRAFTVRCNEGGASCSLSPAPGAAPSAGARPVLSTEGRVLGVCDALGPEAAVHPADCRALRCAGDAECPPIHGPGSGTCIDGLCVDAARPLIASDAVMLCLAGTGTGHAAPRQVERYALGLNCGTPCVVPSPCRKP